jgi:uncharacterized protein
MGDAGANRGRFEVLDAMRGFALCGILLINLPHMGWLMDSDQPVPGTLDGTASKLLWWVEVLFVSGTMRGLFSLLFGASMLLFLAKAERGDATRAGANRLMLRRLAWLFAFGVLDSTLFLWPGDILTIYAMAGLLILPFATRGPRTLAVGAAVVIVGVSAFMTWQQLPKRHILAEAPALEMRLSAGQRLTPDQQETIDRWRKYETGQFADAKDIATERSQRLGSYADNLKFAARTSWQWFTDWLATIRWVFDAVGFMLLGMLLYRLGWLQAEARPRTYALLMLFGYGIGLPLKGIGGVADWRLVSGAGGTQFWQFWLPALTMQSARLLVTLGHVGAFLLAWRVIGWRLRPLQALGKMAFTGYLLQSVLGALAFSGFGLGLWGSLGLAQLWALAALIWAIEIAFAVAWLSRFTMGPFEWIWRALTYGRAPGPLRLRRAVHVGVAG